MPSAALAKASANAEIMRCLKCYIAREVYNTLQADLSGLHPSSPSNRNRRPLLCGSPGFGITRKRA